MELKDKLAVVTGGACRVGRAIVEALAADGAHVVIHCHRHFEEARALAERVKGRVVQADLSEPTGADKLARAVLELEGELALWVNSAASFERRPFLAGDEELWRRTLQLVLLAPVACLRAVAPRMMKGGVVINLLDVAAHQPWSGYAHHCVAKAALLMLTRSLALELAPDLRVCGISPGLVMVPEQGAVERLVARVPLGRAGSPDDVVRAVRYLVAADYVTGAVLPVDGGMTARGAGA